MSVLPGVEVQNFPSQVLEADLQLFIKLPWTYEHGEADYPILYVTDANRFFRSIPPLL